MKKYLSILAVMVVAASAFAQGTVLFQNNAATSILQKPDANPAAAVPANGGFAQLAWAPAGSAYTAWDGTMNLTAWLAANPAWRLAGDPKAIGPVAGRFLGGTLTLTPLAAGGAIDAAVVGWVGTGSFDVAYAAQQSVGISPKFAVTTGNPTTTPPGTAASIIGAGQFAGMTLAPSVIPEPSTFALAGLGAAALLIFRRRK